MPRQLVTVPAKYALQFDGKQNYVNYGSASLLNTNSPVSIFFRFRLFGWNKALRFLGRYTANCWDIEFTPSNQLNFNFFGGSAHSSIRTITDSNQHDFLGTYDGTNLSIYIDGILDSTFTSVGSRTGTGQNFVLSDSNASGYNPNALMWDVRMFGAALSFTDAYDLHNNITQPTGLIFWSQMLEGGGTTTADSSGNGNTGTLGGSPLPAWVPIGIPRAPISIRAGAQNIPCSLSFNGTSTYVSATGPNLTSSDFTIMCWCRNTYNAAYSGNLIFSLGSSGNTDDCLQLGFRANNGILFGFYSDDYNFSNSKASDGRWHHWAFSFQSASRIRSVYCDGVLLGTNTSAAQFAGNTTMAIGRYVPGSNNYLQGNISSLYIYASLLQQPQIVNAMNGNYPTGAAAIYLLQEGSGTIAYDSSGNGNNGTINSGVGYNLDVPVRTRGVVGGNMLYNGNFEVAPLTNTFQTTSSKWLDGTAAGTSTVSTNPYGTGLTGIFGWYCNYISNGCQFTTTNPHSGNYCMLLQATSGTASGIEGINSASAFFANQTNGGIPVSPNTSYTVTFWVNITSVSGSGMLGFQLALYQSNGNASAGSAFTIGGTTATTSGWTQVTETVTTSSTCHYVAFVFKIDCSSGSGAPAMTVYIDDVSLVPATTAQRFPAV